MPLTPLTGVAIPQHPTQDLTRFEETANRGGGGHTRREGLDPSVFCFFCYGAQGKLVVAGVGLRPTTQNPDSGLSSNPPPIRTPFLGFT